MLLRSLFPLAAAAALLGAAEIPAPEMQIDPAQTKVEFTLPDVLHTVHGSFTLKRGTLRFDPATGQASGELVVDAASGASGSSMRDRRMHQTILETDRYPDIIFRPDSVHGKLAPLGPSQLQLHGQFIIHGAAHEISMPVQVDASGGQYTATANFTVPYVQWGMKNPSTLFLRVSDKVEISIHTVARPAPQTSELRP